MFKTKKFWYITLFAILYLVVAGSSFFHALEFFGLANNSWMSVLLSFAFEVGQAAVLFSLLTSKKDRSRIMPWVLMTMFTLVQVIGNVYSSYKYVVLNSIENLKYFKEPIFIWTDLPDAQATVIVVYAVGAILPVSALLLTSMITNYLTDEEEEKKLEIISPTEPSQLKEEPKEEKKNDIEEIKDLNEQLENDVNQKKEIHSPIKESIGEKTNENDETNFENTTEEIDSGEGSTDGVQLPDLSTEENTNTEDKDDNTETEEESKEDNTVVDEATMKQAEQFMNSYGSSSKLNNSKKQSHFIN